MKIKDLSKTKHPQEKLIAKKVENLKDSELLEILLRTGKTGKNVIEIASKFYRNKDLPKILRAYLSKCSYLNTRSAYKIKVLIGVVY